MIRCTVIGLLTSVLVVGSLARASEIVRIVPLDGEDRAARQPRAAVGRSGRIHVVFGVGDVVRCATSGHGGESFGPAVTVGSPGVLSLGMRRGPRISVTDKALIVSAIGGPQGKGKDGDLLVWRSTDGGRTWSGSVRVNKPIASAREGLHALAARPDGVLFSTWLDDRNGRKEVYGATSRDDGLTWSDDLLVYRSPEKSVCECCHPTAEFGPDGALFVMWRNNVNGDRDMYLSRSSDEGRTFSAATRLGKLGWRLNACPMDGGAIAIGPGGVVETIWMRSGTVFSAAPAQAERDRGPGMQPSSAVGASGTFSAWLRRRPGPLVVSSPGDSEPAVLAQSANDPTLSSAADGLGPVVAVWEGGPADPGIYFSRIADRRGRAPSR